jgi:hypothetical protein
MLLVGKHRAPRNTPHRAAKNIVSKNSTLFACLSKQKHDAQPRQNKKRLRSQTAPKAHQPGFDHRRSRPRCPALELVQALSFPSQALVEAHVPVGAEFIVEELLRDRHWN